MAQQETERTTTVPECEALITSAGIISWKKEITADVPEGLFEMCTNPARWFLDRDHEDGAYRLPLCGACAEVIEGQVDPVTLSPEELIEIPISYAPMDGHKFIASVEYLMQSVTHPILQTSTTFMFETCLLCQAGYRHHKEACELYYAYTGQLPAWAPWFAQNKDY